MSWGWELTAITLVIEALVQYEDITACLCQHSTLKVGCTSAARFFLTLAL